MMLPLEEIARHCWADIGSSSDINNSTPSDQQIPFFLTELCLVTPVVVNYAAFIANVFLMMKLNSIIKLHGNMQPPRVFCAMASADAVHVSVCFDHLIELAGVQLYRWHMPQYRHGVF